MFKKLRTLRRRERVWAILKENNPELTRAKFDASYDNINNLMKIVAEIQK